MGKREIAFTPSLSFQDLGSQVDRMKHPVSRKFHLLLSLAEMMRKEGYTFPVYAVNRNSSLMLHADIRVFPTVLILDRNKTVLFKGSLDEAVEKMNTLE